MTSAPDQQTFDQILEQTFPKDIQQKRIRKELISLNDLDQNYYKINLQNSSLGLKVVVEFTELFIQQEIQQNSNLRSPIILELLLDPQFPFNLPKLFCRTPIFQPSLADGRDFLENAIERPWSPTILLREVITSIPTFLKKINRLQNPADSQKMGQYYVGDLYSLEDMLGYETVNLFTGDEVIEKRTTAPRYIVVAESHFLKFETADNSRNTLRLLTWANLDSIANIKRSNSDEKSLLITFLDKEKTNGIAQLMLLTKEAGRLEDLLLDLGERYGAKIKQGAISDFDLTPYTTKLSRQITEKNVEETLEDIAQLETRLEIEVTKDLVYTLMAFYQKIVEHFANYDDPLVDEFVGKLRALMGREDVQIALKNNQENEERKKTQTLTKQKTIDTDIEDEEEKKESNEPYSWQDQDDNNASLDGNDRVIISQSQKLEIQRPVPEEVKNQQEEENEWNEYEGKGTEEAEKETHQIPENKQEEAQENYEYRQEEVAEPEYQAQEQQEENIPVQEEHKEYVENQENQQEEFENYQEEQREVFQNQENQQEEFQNYQQDQREYVENQENHQQEFENYQEEQREVVQNQENQQEEFEDFQQEQQVQEIQQAEAPIQQEEHEAPVQIEEPVQQAEEEFIPEQKEEEVQREEENVREQQEEIQVQENKEEAVEEPVQENQTVEEDVREEAAQENQAEEQTENVEAKVEEEIVPEPVENKEEVQENKEEEVVENREENQEVQEQAESTEQKEEVVEQKEEAKEEENKNEEETTKAEETQGEEQSPEKVEVEGEAEAPENEDEAQGGQAKKNKKKKNKKKK